ncbi:MAG: type IV pilin, partial [Halobacteriota archaeon]
MASRGLSPVAGVVLLAAVGVALVGVTVVVVPWPGEDASTSTGVRLSLSANASEAGGTLTLRHEGGTSIELSEIDIEVSVNGEPLAIQPDIPFFSQAGFKPGPTGPFNTESDNTWEPGESGSFTIAKTTN